MLISSSLCKEPLISARITLSIDNLFNETADMKDPLIRVANTFSELQNSPPNLGDRKGVRWSFRV